MPTCVSTNADDFHCRCDLQVRCGDPDAMGHVNNATYLTYFEVARTAYMQQLGFAVPGDDRPMTAR